jgi:AraC-like DNA-binding protein
MSVYFKKDGFPGQRQCNIPYTFRTRAQFDPISKWAYVTDIGFYPKAQYHGKIRRNGPGEYILMYCVAGKGMCYIGDNEYSLGPNQVLIFPPGIPHKYKADNLYPWTIYWMHFTGINSTELSNYLLEKNFSKPLDVAFNDERNKVFDKMFSAAELAANPEKFNYLSLSLPFYLASFKEESSLGLLDGNKYEPIDVSIKFMKENLSSNYTLKYLAEQVSLSTSHYSTLFHQKTNNSPINYFIYLKMQHACGLLDSTDLSIKLVGLSLGYKDPFHFSRTFKHVIGMSPQKFQNR